MMRTTVVVVVVIMMKKTHLMGNIEKFCCLNYQ